MGWLPRERTMASLLCSVTSTSPDASPSSRVRNALVSAPAALTTGNTVMFSYVAGSSSRQSPSPLLGENGGPEAEATNARLPSVPMPSNPLKRAAMVRSRLVPFGAKRLGFLPFVFGEFLVGVAEGVARGKHRIGPAGLLLLLTGRTELMPHLTDGPLDGLHFHQ